MAVDPLLFQEQIEFFRGKLNIPTERYTDVWKGEHAKGFMVAGANRDDLLADFRVAVDKTITGESTLPDFRRDFESIVARYGWSYNGSPGWRSKVIYQTNVRTSYMAGRYAQMTDPDLVKRRPYWMYKHSDSVMHPRPLHVSWDGLVLPWDAPWWQTHYPPNGWGCKCRVHALSREDLGRMGKTGPDTAPDNGTYEWTNKATGEVHRIPNGIDPGWDYNVGKAAYGQRIAQDAMDAWAAQGARAWERLTPGDWISAGRPAVIPVDAPVASVGMGAADAAGAEKILREMLGGEQKMYTLAGDINYPIIVNAEALASHLDPERARWLPFLDESILTPFEAWLAFERHLGTGQIALRMRLIKVIDLGQDRGLLVVLQARRGALESWTVVPTTDQNYINRQRVGKLVYSR